MTTEIYVQAAAKRDPQNPPHQSRFFVFLVQHYESRVKNIFEKANTGIDEYKTVLAYFDRRGSTHFTRPKRRDIQAVLSTTQTAEERERDLQRISRLPERQQQQPHKTQSIAEKDENDEDETFDERSTTRASG
eukprot:2072559-Amphidinium_carterae.1